MSPHDIYLETQVTTATPQRLRLMLIEAAIRQARRALEFWEAGRETDALDALTRCREIVGELLAGVKEAASPLAKQVLALYVFLLNTLTGAQFSRSREAVEAAIRVLEEDRQTWQLLCEREVNVPPQSAAASTAEEFAPASLAGHFSTSSLSLDA